MWEWKDSLLGPQNTWCKHFEYNNISKLLYHRTNYFATWASLPTHPPPPPISYDAVSAEKRCNPAAYYLHFMIHVGTWFIYALSRIKGWKRFLHFPVHPMRGINGLKAPKPESMSEQQDWIPGRPPLPLPLINERKIQEKAKPRWWMLNLLLWANSDLLSQLVDNIDHSERLLDRWCGVLISILNE